MAGAQRTGRSIYGIRIDLKANSQLAQFATAFDLPRSASFEQNLRGSLQGEKKGANTVALDSVKFEMDLCEI